MLPVRSLLGQAICRPHPLKSPTHLTLYSSFRPLVVPVGRQEAHSNIVFQAIEQQSSEVSNEQNPRLPLET